MMRLTWPAVMLLVCSGAAHAAEVGGSLQWARRVELGMPVSGVIDAVKVRSGDVVEAGAPLVSLDARGFKATLQEAEAAVAKAAAAREEAGRELDRANEMYDRTLLSDHDLQVAKIADTTAAAALKSAEAQRAQARLDLEYSRITAPFGGVILQCNAEAGQTVVNRLQSVPLIAMAELGRMVAQADVDAAALANLTLGHTLTVRVGGKDYEGKVQRLGMEPTGKRDGNPLYALDVLFTYPVGDNLRAGQAATVVLP